MILAVYGTLRRGAAANGLMKGCKFLGTDKVPGILYDLGSFPGLKLTGQEEPGVSVDVYKLPEGEDALAILARIDRYEGHYPDKPDQCLYLRKGTQTLEGGLDVTVYEYRFTAPTVIPSGDFFDVYQKSEV